MPVSYPAHFPPVWLPNGHAQSIYPALFRKLSVRYQRERITTPDDDFLNLDWSLVSAVKNKLVILSHGLEGDSTRQYIVGMVRLLNAYGYDCLAWNYRSCGGESNRTLRFYHSGETSDLDFVVHHALAQGYQQIFLIGFSLGGNVTLKYAGEKGKNIPAALQKVVVFSVPMDLLACSRNIEKPQNKIYLHRFLQSLKPKIAAKAKQYPHDFAWEDWRRVKTFWDFDHYFTGPLHGFSGADDYYARCSSKHFVANITVPTLIINAQNDPLVPYESLPIDLIASLPKVSLELPVHGGHCGFRPHKFEAKGTYWSEMRALHFLENA
ncbi:MAG: YheT family hydrolase [Runella sp.]